MLCLAVNAHETLVSARPNPLEIEHAMLEMLRERGTSTACPSEIARALRPTSWRSLMAAVREVAADLQKRELVDVYQHGVPVKLPTAKGPIRLRLREVISTNYRKHPERYRIGRGEQGVLTVEPYKSELLPLWRFATPEAAKKSSAALWRAFQSYGRKGDFVGMDMARKFLQMGWSRSRRYANHPSGRKYKKGTRQKLSAVNDPVKAKSAEIFRLTYARAMLDPAYRRLREAFKRDVERTFLPDKR